MSISAGLSLAWAARYPESALPHTGRKAGRRPAALLTRSRAHLPGGGIGGVQRRVRGIAHAHADPADADARRRRTSRCSGTSSTRSRGRCLPKSDDLMPNAPRDYRGGIHEGVDFYGIDNCTTIVKGTAVMAAKDGDGDPRRPRLPCPDAGTNWRRPMRTYRRRASRTTPTSSTCSAAGRCGSTTETAS